MAASIIRAVKIYLACTVRGDRGALGAVRALANSLEAAGHTILTRHLLDDDVDAAESALSEDAVFARDIAWLESADLLIAEASGSSYGVGFEVGYVLGRSGLTGQRVVLLFDGARRSVVSRLIAGNRHPNCSTYSYDTPETLLRLVPAFLAQELPR